MPIEPEAIKRASEQTILSLGGEVLPELPWVEVTQPRTQEEAANRSLLLNAVVQIYFGAPIAFIRDWLARNGLSEALSRREREILRKKNAELTDEDKAELYWSIEANWAMAWAGSLIDALPLETPVGDNLAALMPNLQRNEDGSGLRARYRLRTFDELYANRDLYYRAHECTTSRNLNGLGCWTQTQLEKLRKGDRRKVKITRRSRQETTSHALDCQGPSDGDRRKRSRSGEGR